MKKNIHTAAALASVLLLTACAGIQEKMDYIGKPPAMSEIKNPYKEANYKPVSLPMPVQEPQVSTPNSLWQSGSRAFFKDQRAGKVGDILTVFIEIKDEAKMKNKTERARSGEESAGIPSLLGIPQGKIGKMLPSAFDPANLVEMNSDSSSTGDGKIERQEDIDLKLAAVITQILPNGNLVLRGTQEVRVNHELRQLSLSGVIRPEDILNNNSISYEKIAEARISYGGKGEMSDIQVPRYGQQFLDAVLPF